jgi:hypothetical protein
MWDIIGSNMEAISVVSLAAIIICIFVLFAIFWRFSPREEKSKAAKMRPPTDLGQMKQITGRVTNMQAASLSGVNKSAYITLNYAAEGEYIRYKDVTLMLTDSDCYRLPLLGHIVKVFFEGPDVKQHAIPDERVIQYMVSVDSGEK